LTTPLIIFMALLMFLNAVGNPRTSVQDYREKVRPFLEKLYPDRPVTPPPREGSTDTAAVAAVFHLIRSGETDVARQAIDLAAANGFTYAAPYVIGRLEDDDPELRQAARMYLVDAAGRDYGPSAQPWRAWWRNPPHAILGRFGIGHTTMVYATPALVVLAAFLLWGVGRLLGGPPLSWEFASVPLVCGGFMTFVVLAVWLVGSPKEATFGEERIVYHVKGGTVLGLEDARIGGPALLVPLAAVTLLVPLLIVGLASFLSSRRSRAENSGAPSG
jgi:hypothetical protein